MGRLAYAAHAYAWIAIHLSESHRGTPGTATVDWEGIFRGPADGDYPGLVGLESLVGVVLMIGSATLRRETSRRGEEAGSP